MGEVERGELFGLRERGRKQRTGILYGAEWAPSRGELLGAAEVMAQPTARSRSGQRGFTGRLGDEIARIICAYQDPSGRFGPFWRPISIRDQEADSNSIVRPGIRRRCIGDTECPTATQRYYSSFGYRWNRWCWPIKAGL